MIPAHAKRKKRKAAPRKLVCLETYWGEHQARAIRAPSVQPFFEGFSRELDPPLAIAHRHVGTVPQFASYTRRLGLRLFGAAPGRRGQLLAR